MAVLSLLETPAADEVTPELPTLPAALEPAPRQETPEEEAARVKQAYADLSDLDNDNTLPPLAPSALLLDQPGATLQSGQPDAVQSDADTPKWEPYEDPTASLPIADPVITASIRNQPVITPSPPVLHDVSTKTEGGVVCIPISVLQAHGLWDATWGPLDHAPLVLALATKHNALETANIKITHQQRVIADLTIRSSRLERERAEAVTTRDAALASRDTTRQDAMQAQIDDLIAHTKRIESRQDSQEHAHNTITAPHMKGMLDSYDNVLQRLAVTEATQTSLTTRVTNSESALERACTSLKQFTDRSTQAFTDVHILLGEHKALLEGILKDLGQATPRKIAALLARIDSMGHQIVALSRPRDDSALKTISGVANKASELAHHHANTLLHVEDTLRILSSDVVCMWANHQRLRDRVDVDWREVYGVVDDPDAPTLYIQTVPESVPHDVNVRVADKDMQLEPHHLYRAPSHVPALGTCSHSNTHSVLQSPEQGGGTTRAYSPFSHTQSAQQSDQTSQISDSDSPALLNPFTNANIQIPTDIPTHADNTQGNLTDRPTGPELQSRIPESIGLLPLQSHLGFNQSAGRSPVLILTSQQPGNHNSFNRRHGHPTKHNPWTLTPTRSKRKPKHLNAPTHNQLHRLTPPPHPKSQENKRANPKHHPRPPWSPILPHPCDAQHE